MDHGHGHAREADLWDCAAGTLEADRLQDVEAHLRSGCARCDRILAACQRILSDLRLGRLEPAPEEWVVAAVERIAGLETESGRTAPLPEEVRRAVARTVASVRSELVRLTMSLVIDTAAGLAWKGIRAGGAPPRRQLVFESPSGSLHLEVEPDPDGRFHVRGQFLRPPEGPAAPGGGRAVLTHSNRRLARRLSRRGEFHFPPVSAESISLSIEIGEESCETGAIALGQGRPMRG